MIDTWNPAKLNEKISGRDSWNPAILNETVTDRDSWNPAILNESAGETPVVFEATITASFPEGATCTATDGTTTLTADDNPMAFSIPNEGTWAVACVANGVTLSEDVVITTNGQMETVDLTPVGATVTPTDSVPMLIACAGIGDSEITTIAGALADVETLTAILESENAIDYLVRSTTFASDVTSDSVAMTGIGAINYDANTLLGNSTWRNAICNSTYFESVLNVKVPLMTSDTTPEGVVSAIGAQSGYESYKAFDRNPNTSWYIGNQSKTPWIQYQFTAAKKIYKAYVDVPSSTKTFIVQFLGSNDGSTFTDLTESYTYPTTDNGEHSEILDGTSYQYLRCNCKRSDANAGSVEELQFYGRVDVN